MLNAIIPVVPAQTAIVVQPVLVLIANSLSLVRSHKAVPLWDGFFVAVYDIRLSFEAVVFRITLCHNAGVKTIVIHLKTFLV